MNVYFCPNGFNQKNFDVFLEILKIKKVICFNSYHPHIDNEMLIHEGKMDYEENWEVKSEEIKKAVYKFISLIYEPIRHHGYLTGQFKIKNTYDNSKAYNPIYNLEHCDDDNVLVVGYNAYEGENNPNSYFTKYSLNILKKYMKEQHYENKICFIQFNDSYNDIDYRSIYDIDYTIMFFNMTSVFCGKRFKSLLRITPITDYLELNIKMGHSYSIYSIPKDSKFRNNINTLVRYYDPLISYLNIKSKELYPNRRKESDIIDFFIESPNELDEMFFNKVDELTESNNESFYSDDISLEIAREELDYIRNNGGDWIDY